MAVHYENNNPFLVVSKLERVIELSMWGNIAIEETIDVKHNGAKLKGSFSRYEFQGENSGVSSVKSFKTVLPASGPHACNHHRKWPRQCATVPKGTERDILRNNRRGRHCKTDTELWP